MLQLQSLFGVFALLAIAWLFSENHRAVSLRQAAIGLVVTLLTAVALIKLPFVAHGFGVINDAVGTISAASRAGTSFVFGYLGGGCAAVRAEDAGRGFHPGVSGAADRAGHERAHHAVVLLAGAAAGRARHGVGARAHARRRRRGGPVHRRQHLSRHGGIAAVHPAVSGQADAQRIVPGDDRRHGRDRRHRARALRHAAGAADSGRGGAFRHRLGAGRAGGDPGQPDHGAGDHRRQDRRRAGRSRHARLLHHGCDRQGHLGRARTPAQHRRDADRAGGAGLSRQRRSSDCCPPSAAAEFRCSGCSAT